MQGVGLSGINLAVPSPVMLTYAQKIRSIETASQIGYWPQWELTGAVAENLAGTTAADKALRDGAYTGVTLGQTPGIGDHRTVPLYDGANDYTNIFSPSFRDTFNYSEFALAMWAKVSGAGVWTDGAFRYICKLGTDAGNRASVLKRNANNSIRFQYLGAIITDTAISSVDWTHFAITVSTIADEARAYINGVQVGATLGGLGAWVGVLVNGRTSIGTSLEAGPNEVWDGNISHVSVWNTPLTPAQILVSATVQ